VKALPASETLSPEDQAVFAGVDEAVAAIGQRVRYTRWDDVRLEQVNWLMINRLPQAELTIVEGDGDLGKTTAVLDIAARLSRGADMPDGSRVEGAADVLLVAEEDRVSILKARLIAAGADLDKIHRLEDVDGGRFSLPEHAQVLHAEAQRCNAKLIVIDALFNHFDTGLNTNTTEDVRRVLAPLSDIAHRTGAAIVAIRHWGKTVRAASARGLGSADIRNVARSTLVVGKHPSDDRVRVIALDKSNLGPGASTPPEPTRWTRCSIAYWSAKP